MKIKFKAKGIQQPNYTIVVSTINDIDLSLFPVGGKFIGDEATQAAGIYDVEYVDSELHVTLAQTGLAYQCQPTNGSHDWVESDWIDATEYDDNTVYILATSKPDNAEYLKTEAGCTVTLPEVGESEDELV